MATRDLAVRIFGDSKDINQAFDEAGGGASTMGTKFAKVGAGIAVVGGAVAAGTAIAKGFADAASDLGEAQSKVGTIFGDSAADIDAFADTAARTFGLSDREVNQFAGSFGGLLKSTGLGEEAFAGMSTELIALTSDLGSFNNMANEDAAAKLQAGLIGSYEPLQSMNIFLTAATVSAKAMEMGLADANGEISEGAKVQARYALIMEQTGDAQGDFARTSDGMANSQKMLGAEFENMQAALGEKLAPVFAEVFGYMAEVLPEIIDWLGPKLTAAGEAMAAFWDENGPGILAFFESVGSVLSSAWDVVKPIFGEDGFFTKAMENIGQIFSGVVTTIQGILDGDWTMMWNGIKDIVSGAFGLLWAWFDLQKDVFLSVGGDMMGWIGDGIMAAVNAVGDAIWNSLPREIRWGLEYGSKGVGFVTDAVGMTGGGSLAENQNIEELIASGRVSGWRPDNVSAANYAVIQNFYNNDVSGQGAAAIANEAARSGAGGTG